MLMLIVMMLKMTIYKGSFSNLLNVKNNVLVHVTKPSTNDDTDGQDDDDDYGNFDDKDDKLKTNTNM